MDDRKIRSNDFGRLPPLPVSIFLPVVFLSVAASPLCLAADPAPAVPPQPADYLRDAYREDAEKCAFSRADGQPLKLIAEPIMRWANDDSWSGDVFAWTHQGRPEVVGCILSGPGAAGVRYVYHECHLLAEKPIAAANVQDGRRWQSAEGLKIERLDDAPKPADSAAARLVQMRSIARSFTAYMQADGTWELRLLTQPLMRYGDDKSAAADGALFSYVWTKGTDPELILLVECRRDDQEVAWCYAPIRFSNRSLWLKRDGKEIWRAESHREPAGKITTQLYTTAFARSMPDARKPR